MYCIFCGPSHAFVSVAQLVRASDCYQLGNIQLHQEVDSSNLSGDASLFANLFAVLHSASISAAPFGRRDGKGKEHSLFGPGPLQQCYHEQLPQSHCASVTTLIAVPE